MGLECFVTGRDGTVELPLCFCTSSRTLDDVIYPQELNTMADGDPNLLVINTLTRKQPEGWTDRPLCQTELDGADAILPSGSPRYLEVVNH
jgi:hypothetical protein